MDAELKARLERMEAMLQALIERQQVREWYSTEQVAKQLGRSAYTVRQWFRHGRLRAERRMSGRGKYSAYVVSHSELMRFEREGLRPCQQPAGHVTYDGDSL